MNNVPHSPIAYSDENQKMVDVFLKDYSGASTISAILSKELQSIPLDILRVCIMNYTVANQTWFQDLEIKGSHLYLKMSSVTYSSPSSDAFNNRIYQQKFWQTTK